mgnify:CR=1 FL=1
MEFEWNELKGRGNISKHSVSFEEATEVFADELSLTLADPDRSEGEERFLIFGRSYRGKHLVVAFAERGARLRIISARPMTRHERQAYEN